VFSLTSRIAEGRKIKVKKLDAQVSLAPRPISYSGFAARVFANRKSDSGRFGDPEKEVASGGQSRPQSGGTSSQRHPCGKRDSKEKVQEGGNCCCLSCDHAGSG
jgi:hypothetical protein